jgi:cellobiose-specific phosphotransferase system component IIC
MRHILAIPFVIATVVLTLCVLYCVFMGLVDDPAWFFVGLGVLLSDIVSFVIARMMLRN